MRWLKHKGRFAILVIVVILAGGLTYGYYRYNEPRATASLGHADLETDAQTIYHDFEADEIIAGRKYLNKIVAVKGVVQEIDSSAGNMAILLATGATGMINCAMTGVAGDIRLNDPITIKGTCAGFMMDVMLVDCVIPEKNK